MNTESNHTQAELNEIVRLASESAIAEEQDLGMAKLVQAIQATSELVKGALETVGIAGYRKHLETQGFKCSSDRLRRALIQARLWRPKRRKTKPVAT